MRCASAESGLLPKCSCGSPCASGPTHSVTHGASQMDELQFLKICGACGAHFISFSHLLILCCFHRPLLCGLCFPVQTVQIWVNGARCGCEVRMGPAEGCSPSPEHSALPDLCVWCSHLRHCPCGHSLSPPYLRHSSSIMVPSTAKCQKKRRKERKKEGGEEKRGERKEGGDQFN